MTLIPGGRILRGHLVEGFLSKEWEELAEANPRATIFQTSGWYLAWIEKVSAHESVEPLIIRVPAEGKSRVAVALQISRGTDKTIRPLSYPWADYHDGVGSLSDTEAIASLARVLDEYIREQKCSFILDDIVAGGMWEQILAKIPIGEEESSCTGSIDLNNGEHIQDLLGKKEYKIKWRRLQRLGKVQCHHHIKEESILERFPFFVTLHRNQWEGRPDAVAPFDGKVIDGAFEHIARFMARSETMVLTELTLDDRPIAMYYGFRYRGRYFAYRTAYDVTFRRFSPGHLMLNRMITDFHAGGLGELDLMRGNYVYKRQYTDIYRRNKRFTMRVQ